MCFSFELQTLSLVFILVIRRAVSIFSSALLTFRKKNNKTQLELVNFLASTNINCERIDVGTISRWETRKTKPTMKRQLGVLFSLKLFDDMHNLINAYKYKKKELEYAINKRYNQRGGNNWFYVNLEQLNYLTYSNLTQLPTYFLDSYRKNVIENLRDSFLNEQYNSKVTLFFNDSNYPVGHVVYSSMHVCMFKETYLYKNSIFVNFDLLNEVVVIPSLYSVSPKVLGNIIKIMLTEILYRVNDLSSVVLINRVCGSDELLRIFGGDVIAFGPKSSENQGVLHNKTWYRWIIYSFCPYELVSSLISAKNLLLL